MYIISGGELCRDPGILRNVLLSEGLVEEPCYDREVAALIVCREEDRVLVLLRRRSHCDFVFVILLQNGE